MALQTVLLAEPRGFCAGVDMAIKALAWMVRIFEPPVYCFHEIVHNQLVVDRFERLGVRFVDDISEVPPGAPIMLSAHGSAPEVVDAAYARQRVVVDAVCPLVTKVHHEARRRAEQGYEIVYVGHAGHDEAVGTLAVAPESMHLVESESDLPALFSDIGDDAPVALLTQTTLSTDEWDGVLRRTQSQYPQLWTAGRSDLCFATTNRQAAVRAIAPRCDAIIVIGSANSSNTLALAHVAAEAGCPMVQRVNGADEIDMDALHSASVVGVTAGASAPEDVVQAVVERLNPVVGVERVRVTEEDEYFPPPRGLRELMPLVEILSAFSVGGDPRAARSGGSFTDDRNVDTALTLGALSARSVGQS
ncbi:MAG: 4-hydroxy-3-methylbut-2-enyl diphosphate reductase [Actinobacteria bacterium]|nr:4-hydroxy-3-methylbut-2-enyl diphosphate reductase [Actinomycetota bacterium]MCB9388597.1 4-hydroxy-3-methylbut-2-enyl diphosphate reductase [Acidimicrobiia bacterium]